MKNHHSAYRVLHSMETALHKVKTDVIKALENQEVACHVLLDLSTACDTIDHDTLLSRIAQNWFRSYLTNITQATVICDLLLEGSKSASILLTSGIQQGSVLGPLLFTLYMIPLGDMCRKNGIEFHLYADDTQICITFKPSVPTSKSDCITSKEKCMKKINI